MPYTFDFLTQNGDVDHFDIVYCSDDRQAREMARLALLVSTRATRVVVWEDERSFSVERNDATSRDGLAPT